MVLKKQKPKSALVESINYRLSFCYKVKKSDKTIKLKNINSLNIEQIKDYIYNNYYVKFKSCKTIKRDKLLKDLVVFKTYKEDLEIKIKNDSLIKDHFDLFLKVITIYISLHSISLKISNNAENDKDYIAGLLIVITFIIVFSVIWTFITTGKKSDSTRLKVVNYGIHTLEAIKEEMDRKVTY